MNYYLYIKTGPEPSGISAQYLNDNLNEDRGCPNQHWGFFSTNESFLQKHNYVPASTKNAISTLDYKFYTILPYIFLCTVFSCYK